MADDRRSGTRKSSIASRSLIHEPSLQAGDGPAVYPLVPLLRRAVCYTVWILHNGSSVIILHLLSMTANLCASHNIAVFLRDGLIDLTTDGMTEKHERQSGRTEVRPNRESDLCDSRHGHRLREIDKK